ncbi:tripartite tricarboxylate transporter TctB family protein [Virgibacillus byunsanensis]|uniref:Tripartite tricarboxylate transporter TctB family protein n=1 Tax=Virgibacillus byunsanensis TaxID=570945 RepID=A0ABW3LFX7_9BACI
MVINSERALAIGFFCFSLFMFVASLNITSSITTGAAGPSFFPRLWSIILGILSILYFFEAGKRIDPDSHKGLKQTLRENKKVFIMLAAVLVYIFLLDYLGYIISTFSLLTFAIYILDIKKEISKLKIYMISLVVTLGTYFVFTNILNVFLPSGIFY